jgi:hypothetical protein
LSSAHFVISDTTNHFMGFSLYKEYVFYEWEGWEELTSHFPVEITGAKAEYVMFTFGVEL